MFEPYINMIKSYACYSVWNISKLSFDLTSATEASLFGDGVDDDFIVEEEN